MPCYAQIGQYLQGFQSRKVTTTRKNFSLERLLAYWPAFAPLPLPRWLLHRYWVIQHVYEQQWEMYRNQGQALR